MDPAISLMVTDNTFRIYSYLPAHGLLENPSSSSIAWE
jgi:hypothetical protein